MAREQAPLIATCGELPQRFRGMDRGERRVAKAAWNARALSGADRAEAERAAANAVRLARKRGREYERVLSRRP